MYGAILGDIIGRPYEFDRGSKTKVFPLFSTDSAFTADTVMTIAVAEAFMNAPNDERAIRRHLIASIFKFAIMQQKEDRVTSVLFLVSLVGNYRPRS